jgi:hypothetical protein
MPYGEVLGDPAPHLVPHDRRVCDPERIEELKDAFGVPLDADVSAERAVAAPVAEEVDDDYTMSLGCKRDDFAPEVG